MNKRIQTKFGPYPILATLLAVVACTLRTVATFLGVDAFGYFENSTLYRVSVWMTVAAVLLLLTLPLAYRKRQAVLAEQTTPHTFLPSLMMGMLFLFFLGEGIFSLLGTLFLPTIDNLAYALTLILGLFSCIYFFSLAILESKENDRKANFGMACVLFFGVYSAYLYLNTEMPRNAHIELCEEMTWIALMLYFLYEVRIALGKQKQNLYVSFAMIGGLLCAYNVIPTFIYYIATGRLLASSFTAFLLLCGTLAFILMRLALFAKSPVDAPIPLVENLLKLARAREEEVREIEAFYAPALPEEETEDLTEISPSSEEPTEDSEQAGETNISETPSEALPLEEAERAEEVSVEEEAEPTENTSVEEETNSSEDMSIEAEEGEMEAMTEEVATQDEPEDATAEETEFILPSQEIAPSLPQASAIQEEISPAPMSEHNEPKEEENEENISN